MANILWVFSLCTSHTLPHLILKTNLGVGSIIVLVIDKETEGAEMWRYLTDVEMRLKPRNLIPEYVFNHYTILWL